MVRPSACNTFISARDRSCELKQGVPPMPKTSAPANAIFSPMRIQARSGSPVEQYYYSRSSLPGTPWPPPLAIAPGVNPSPLEDLIFHGGKTVPQMGFKNIFLGSHRDWQPSNIA